MSRGHFSPSSEITHLIASAAQMTPYQLMDFYGIQILEDGQVYDVTYELTYKNIQEWARVVVEEDGSGGFDDDDDYDKYGDDEDY